MKSIILTLAVLFLAIACAPAAGLGRAVFTITDAAANIGSVTSIKVTIDSVQVHSAEEGWVTVSSKTQTFDLLKLKASGTQALLADLSLKPGTYEQVRLEVTKVVVTDSTGDHTAKLPSGDLKIVGELKVNANSTSTAKFDFLADESLHVTGKGEYILAPVVHLETKEDVDVDDHDEEDVKVEHGKVHTDEEVGMDEEGNVGIGLKIKRELNLTIGEDGRIKIGALVSAAARAQEEQKSQASSSGTNSSAEANASVTVNARVGY